MKALVFGGSGFIGSHVCDALTQAGHEVTVFDCVPSPYLTVGQRMVIGDILNPSQVNAAVMKSDAVYNFAGFADLDSATTQPQTVAELNILGNLNILEACRKEKAFKRFVYASTIYVYSESGGFYRCSKQASELFIEEYNRKFALPFTILRFGTVYGPRADARNSMYRYIRQAVSEGAITFAGNGQELREYIHVRDAAMLSVQALEEQYQNSRLVLTGHQGIKVNDMFTTIFEILKKPAAIHYQEAKHQDHYAMTPYSYVPKVGKKLVATCFTDIGQGLIECLTDMESAQREEVSTTAS